MDLVVTDRVGGGIRDEGKGEGRENGRQLHDWSLVGGWWDGVRFYELTEM